MTNQNQQKSTLTNQDLKQAHKLWVWGGGWRQIIACLSSTDKEDRLQNIFVVVLVRLPSTVLTVSVSVTVRLSGSQYSYFDKF